MKRLLITLLCSAALFAQDQVSRVVQLRHIPPGSVQVVLAVLSGGKVIFQSDSNANIVAMRGPLELVDAMEAAIKKLDVPAPAIKNIELTFQMLLASPQGESPAIAPELTGVVQQLRNVFGLKSIRVLETAVLRGREGKGGLTNGMMAPPSKVDAPATYLIAYDTTEVSAGEKGAHVRINKLRFNTKIPLANGAGSVQFFESGINTDVDVREGQKVVVGKSSIDGASQSIFLVVTAKVVD